MNPAFAPPAIKLPHDPLGVFKNSKTPGGLYARQKWLGQEKAEAWQRDYREVVIQLRSGQLPNGSWDNSIVSTIQRLFGLHLTVRNADASIDHAIDWLLNVELLQSFINTPKRQTEKIAPDALHNLPFTKGCFGHFAIGAILFHATNFDREKDERVLEMYERLSQMIEKEHGRLCSGSCMNNILRAFIVHPQYAHGKAMQMAVDMLEHLQEPSGKWLSHIPFYQTVNILAHLEFGSADAQLRFAFQRLLTTQNRDGTWGKTQREWNTFLIVHAIKRKNSVLKIFLD